MVNLISILAFASVLIYNAHAEKKVVCYYGSWSTYRHGNGQFGIEHIDPFICTHLVYSFVGLDYDYKSIRVMDSWLDLPTGRDYFRKFSKLKLRNPKLKTLVAIGGWNEGSARYSIMVNDANLRGQFVQNALKFVLEYDFDGLDFDWEYPNQRDSVNGEKDVLAFTLLLKELKEAFSKSGLLVTAAVASVESSAGKSYEIPTIAKYLDFINVMTYDLHGGWGSATGHNAGLYDSEGQTDNLTVSRAVGYWLEQGVPPEKLILGAPLYGRTFRLVNSANNYIGAPSSGPGIAGPYSGENGNIGYNEFCEKLLTEKDWTLNWDSEALVPYAVKGNNWISFDNLESIRRKAEFALSKNLGGVMVWSIETDDFRGICNKQKFEVLRTINEALGRDVPIEEIPEATTETVDGSVEIPEIPQIPETNPNSLCTGGSTFVRDPDNCSVFYLCVLNAIGDFVAHRFKCPADLVFDTEHNSCNYRNKVQC